MSTYNAIDLFAGCGGLSEGMVQAGFKTVASLEINPDAVRAYKMNHPNTYVIENDIRKVDISSVRSLLNGEPLHLLAGCPPCQGFSSMRRLNKKRSKKDSRNNLVMEFLRFVEELEPYTIMMENVPGLENYYLFKKMVKRLRELGYNPKYKVLNVREFGVPQSRERLVLIGSRLGKINILEETGERITVREAIEGIELMEETADPLHKITIKHSDKIKEMISLIPKNGGSRKDLPEKYILTCHKKENVGFADVYGRLRWDDFSTTITGGCLNPSKGRFLHPEFDRVITPREAALLQSFPKDYQLPTDIRKDAIALLIGNALPPKFSFAHSYHIKSHIEAILSK